MKSERRHIFIAGFVLALAVLGAVAWSDWRYVVRTRETTARAEQSQQGQWAAEATRAGSVAVWLSFAGIGLAAALFVVVFAVVLGENQLRRWLSWKAQPVAEEGLIYATARDITDRKRVEDHLVEILDEMSAFKAALDEHAIVAVTNARGKMTYVNDKFCAISKYAREELLGQDHRIINSGHHPKAFMRELWQTISSGRVWQGEIKNRAKDGTFYWVATTIVPFLDVHGIPVQYVAIRADITERKSFEWKLWEANRFLDSVIENIPNMVFIKDATNLRFIRINRAGETLLGRSRDQLILHNDHDLFPEEQADVFTAADREVLAGGNLLDIPEERIQTKDGETRILHTKKLPVHDETGLPKYLLGISEDVTERVHAEAAIRRLNTELRLQAAQLVEANQQLESFSYSVSHDLRAPLRHVHGYVEMLQRATAGQLSEKAQRYVTTISEASTEMGRLIDDLLAFSRMGRDEMRESPVDLNVLVQDTIRGLELPTRGRNIVWQVTRLPAVVGDRSMLKQVLVNLVGNAVKYSRQRDPAHIEIGYAGEEDGRVILFVRDNGAGFDMEYAHKLFGVFQRLHRSEEFEGTGIGLATVRRIVARHDGRVWAEGAVDQGATFYFTLPRAPSA